MSTAVAETMTLAEFDALPDDPAVDRSLLFGKLVEKPMTVRNPLHSSTEVVISRILDVWRISQSPSPGRVYCGEVGCDLPEIDTRVGIDVAYFSNAVLDAQEDSRKCIVGPPVLAVEILSPSDSVEEINRKVDAYLQAGVKLVWIVDPYRKSVTVHRPDEKSRLFNAGEMIDGEPHMPGLSFDVAEIFE